MNTRSKDFPVIIRNVFAGILLFTIIQKIINPVQYENFSDFIVLLFNLITDKDFHTARFLYVIVIFMEIFIITGLYIRKLFSLALILGFILIGTGLIGSGLSMYFGLKSTCGCGLFGDIPSLLIVQKFILFLLMVFIYRNKYIFTGMEDIRPINGKK